ncbi:MAG: hypothetical protein EOP33_01065 [Rickettsiaceae bacterium]|nr:MAG: hypothetical protein EOP33_01065 [Rickettsiaceae bacterium]
MEIINNHYNKSVTNREQFLLDRKAGIGGSDVAAIMGLSPFKTALEVYLDKTNYDHISEEFSNDLKRGNRAEKYILEEYAETTGETLEYNLPKLVDKTYPFMIGHIDAKVQGQNVIVEAKSTKILPKVWSEELPQQYLLQVAYYANLYDADRVDIAVLFSGWEYRCFTYWRNIELEEHIRRSVIKFWTQHILTKIPPAPQNLGELKAANLIIDHTKIIEANDEIKCAVEQLNRITMARKELEKDENALKFRIQEYMGDAMMLDAGNYKAILQDRSINRLDINSLKIDCPNIYQNYLKKTENRVLKLSGS